MPDAGLPGPSAFPPLELDRFFDLHPDLLATASLREGRWKRVNPAMTRVLGWGEAELLSRPLFELVHPDDLERSRAAAAELVGGKPLVEFEHRLLCRDGSYRWIVWSTAYFPAEDMAYCVGRDATERKRATRARHESDARYRKLFESMSEGFVVGELIRDGAGRVIDYRFLEVNAAYERLTGLSRRESLGKTILELIPTLEPAWIQTHTRVVETGEPIHWRSHNAQTGKTYEIYSYRPEPGLFASIFTDATERRRLDDALRESEERFRVMADGLPLIVYVHDQEGRQRFVNRTFCEFFGVDASRTSGDGWRILLHPEDAAGYAAEFEACVRERRPFHAEARVRRADGEWRWIESWARPRLSGSGEFLGFVGTSADVTERRRSEQAASAQRSLLNAIIDNIPVLLCIWDPELKAFRFNKQMREVLGWTEDDAAAGDFMALVYPDADYRRQVIDYMLSLRSGWRDLYCAAKDGSRVEVAWANIRLPDGTSIGIGVDIRERKRAEAELRASKEETERLARTLEDRVRERTAEIERRSAQLRALHSELSRAEERERRHLAAVLHDGLQQLLVAAKMRVGMTRERADESLRPGLQQVDEMLAQAIEASRSLTVELSPPLLHDRGLVPALQWLGRQMQEKHRLEVEVAAGADAEPAGEDLKLLLYQAARELLFNVAKHAGVGRVRLALDREDSRVRLEVADEGRGFEPDRAGERGPTFGLFSLQQRAESLGGELAVASAPGQGTRIRLEVPDEASPPAAQVPPRPGARRPHAAPPRPDGRLRVLVADDHDIVRDGLVKLLGDYPGLEIVAEAKDGLQAVALARQHRPDIVVMDVSMPRLDGAEAARRIAAELPGTCILGLSMHDSPEVERAMREAGAAGYLPKDAPIEDLVQLILASARRRAAPA